MATLMHVIHSSKIMGVVSFAGVPYGCGHINIHKCTGDDVIALMTSLADEKKIDDPRNIASHAVYLFHGANDWIVDRSMSQVMLDYYTKLGANVRYNMSFCGHGMPTYDYGVNCDVTKQPLLNNCGWSGAHEALSYIYGDVIQETSSAHGELYEFDQREFTDGFLAHSMDTSGYVFVPDACYDRSTECRLHVAFHGCTQGRDSIGDHFARFAGYNEVAASSNIIILYPQVRAHDELYNPNGCWDFWGYTGKDYLVNSGKQTIAVAAMIDWIVAE